MRHLQSLSVIPESPAPAGQVLDVFATWLVYTEQVIDYLAVHDPALAAAVDFDLIFEAVCLQQSGQIRVRWLEAINA